MFSLAGRRRPTGKPVRITSQLFPHKSVHHIILNPETQLKSQ